MTVFAYSVSSTHEIIGSLHIWSWQVSSSSLPSLPSIELKLRILNYELSRQYQGVCFLLSLVKREGTLAITEPCGSIHTFHPILFQRFVSPRALQHISVISLTEAYVVQFLGTTHYSGEKLPSVPIDNAGAGALLRLKSHRTL